MNVYIVIQNWPDEYICGVYTSYEEALSAIMKYTDIQYRSNYIIEEITVGIWKE